jgi:hypothetical protein
MGESTPAQHEQTPPSLEEGIASLEFRVMPKGRPMVFDPTTARFTDPTDLTEADAVVGLVEVDVEDPNAPGMPIMYDTALFTAAGSANYGIRVQLTQDATKPKDEYPSSIIYRIKTDGTVLRFLKAGSASGITETEQRLLDPPEVDELADQLLTLDKPSDQRLFPTVLK